MKKILITLLSIVFALSITSCDSYLDINRNPNAPDFVDSYLKLAPIIQYMGGQGIYWDITYAMASLTQMWGSSSQTSFANNHYPASSDAGGQYWRVAYFDHGFNLEEMINQCLDRGEYAFAGIGLIIKAYDWDVITKIHGEIPYFSKYTPGQTVFPYDYQKDIYPDIRALAYQGIKYIEMEEGNMTKYGTLISANDYIYRGDVAKWKKFAYAILARNYISLSNKRDFVRDYADSVIYCVQRSFASSADDAVIATAPVGTTTTSHYNFWGPMRGNLGNSYFQHQFAVQTLSGTVIRRDESSGEKIRNDNGNAQQRIWYPYQLNTQQIICDTIRSVPGHCDPRITVLLGFEEKKYSDYLNTDTILIIKARPNPGVGDGYLYDTTKMRYTQAFPTEVDYVKHYMSKRYVGGTFTSYNSTSATGVSVLPSYKLYWETGNAYTHYAANFYSKNITTTTNATTSGYGRWLYRDDAPFILSTYSEMKFCAAEAYWKKGEKANALQALKEGVAAHMDFCQKYIYIPTAGGVGGDKITATTFRTLANEYLAGPYVGGLTVDNLTLSHIMLQKWVALYPWGANEAWVDMRKYHYDIAYTGDYPKKGNGWAIDRLDQKWDSNPNKVYKGFFLLPSIAYGSGSNAYNLNNDGSPCYRLRPRYNSEYIWNVPSLEKIKPISGNAPNYHTSIPWFAYPGDVPDNL